MRKFFISSHGTLASGIKSALQVLLGKTDNVTVFDAYINEDSVEEHVEAFLKTLSQDDQGIMLSDLYGGSVNQVLYRYQKKNVFLISGINLAIVLELVAQSDAPITSEILDETINSARNALKRCHLDDSKVSEEDFF